MRRQISKKMFINGTLWKLFETLMTVGTSFVVSIILARILSAEEFGVIALANVIINFSEILLQGAFTAPLIHKEDVDDTDYTSVLAFSLIAALVLYIFVYFFAPAVSMIYKEEDLTKVLRLIALIFFFQAFGSVRVAIVSRNIRFKTLSICTIVAAITSGVIGIVMAKYGFGVFSLVFQKIIHQAILNILLLAIIRWKPRFKNISFSKVKGLLSFGSKVLGSSLVSYTSDSMVSVVSGKFYSVKALGYSSKGVQYPCDLSIFSFQAVATALFPTLSSYQNDVILQKKIMKKVVSTSTYLLFPMLIGMFAVSEKLTVFLLTEKWISAVPFMKMACVYYCATPLMLLNIQLYHSRGNGNIRLFTELIKLVLTGMCIIAGVVFFEISLEKLFFFRTLIEIIITIVSIIGLKKSIDYSFVEYFIDIFKPLFQSIVMALIVTAFGLILGVYGFDDNIILFIQVGVGVLTYWILSIVFKPIGYIEMKKIIKEKNGK